MILISQYLNYMKSAHTSEQLEEYLKAMGIQTWVRRSQTLVADSGDNDVVEVDMEVELPAQTGNETADGETVQSPSRVKPLPGEVITGDISQFDWSQLKTAVETCTACPLHETRTNTVFGIGDHNAQVMVIGEAPGADEDQQGEPFVGRAGKLLNNMLMAIGYKREQVYIANILKCRPPGNRDPDLEEISQCEHFLKRQVELIKPKVILAVGRIAAHNLMKVETPIGKMRGKLHYYDETPVVVTYHPAYLLRKPSEKAKAWDDLRFALKVIQGRN